MKSKKKSPEAFGEASYRAGALERLDDAYSLLNADRFAGAIYMAGRSVEGMLRALVWKTDPEVRQGKKTLDTGHDLRELLKRVRNLGLLRAGGRDDEFEARVQHVGRLWFNNMRFASSSFLEARWRKLGEVHKRRTLKQAAGDFYEASSAVVKRCEALCRKTSSNGS